MVSSLRILVADPDEIWRRGFRRLIEDRAGWELCGEAVADDDVVRLAAEESPDVVALDGGFSLGTIVEIKARRPEARILVFGAHQEPDVVRGFLHAGVLALVSKSDRVETIRQALEAVSKDELFLSPGVSEHVIEQYLSDSASHAKDQGTSAKTLTSRERDVVRLLSDGKTNRAAAAELDISVKTVENHRANAMRKLGARSVADLVRAAIRAGLVES
jgi:DNA-binding NarL/FixJ family response regulator